MESEPLTPEPFQQLYQLYAMHFFYSMINRMWDMGIVLLLAALTSNDFSIVALCGLSASLVIFLCMPMIGKYFLDTYNRLFVIQSFLILKFIAVTTAYLICIMLFYHQRQNTQPISYSIYSITIFYVITNISFISITQCIEKDWVVILSNSDSRWLSNTNAIMSQIDLACASIAPIITGFLFYFSSLYNTNGSNLGNIIVAMILLLLNAISTIALYIFLSLLYSTWPSLSVRKTFDFNDETTSSDIGLQFRNSEQSFENVSDISSVGFMTEDDDDDIYTTSTDTKGSNSRKKKNNKNNNYQCSCIYSLCTSIIETMSHFRESNCAGAMIAYSLLYCTVLSYGSLMTVYLRWAGVSDDWIGISRGSSSLAGFLGALFYPYCKKKYGLYQTGQIAIVYQCSLVALAAVSFFYYSILSSALILIVTVVRVYSVLF